MKADTLYRLQELLDKVKWIDKKILDVDIHIGRIYHVIDRSGLAIPPPVLASEDTGNLAVTVDGCASVPHSYQFTNLTRFFYFLAVHSVRLGDESGYISITLD
jgi:hypothetical protein